MACDGVCILEFGEAFTGNPNADDTLIWKAAFDFLNGQGGGKLVLPVGTSNTTSPLRVPTNTIIEGQGRETTKVINASSDVFIIGLLPEPHAPREYHSISFRDLSVVSQLNNGGHIFVLDGRATACSWKHVYLLQLNDSKQIFRRVTHSVTGGFFDCLWEHVYMQHSAMDQDPTSTVPAFEVSAPSQQFNSNTLRNLRCENSNTQPFFKFTCNAMQRNNNCVMSQINFEKCFGGMVHWYSAGNWTCEALVQFDIPQDPRNPTRNHGFYLSRGSDSPSDPGPPCRHMTFIGCDRREGFLGTTPQPVFDIRLEHAEHVVLINCGENSAARYTVDANDLPITWIGMRDPTQFTERQLLRPAQAVRIGNGQVRAPKIQPDLVHPIG